MKMNFNIVSTLLLVSSLLFFTACNTNDKQTLVADAGEDIVVIENELFTFDGSKSYDKNGNTIVSYEWYCIDFEISLYKGPKSTLTMPAQRDPGTYNTKLVITNDKNETAVDHFKVIIEESSENDLNNSNYTMGITINEFKELQSQGITYIDIRTAPEWNTTGIIEGSYTITNPVSIDAWLQEGSTFSNIITSKEQNIILICSSGSRAYITANALKEKGYTNVHYLTGGIAPWIQSGEPVVTPN